MSGYGHSQMDQTAPYQHLSSAATPSHLMPGMQPQSQMPNQPNHLNPSHISSIPAQQQQTQSQSLPVNQHTPHSQNHSQHSVHMPPQANQPSNQQTGQLAPMQQAMDTEKVYGSMNIPQQAAPQTQQGPHPSLMHSGLFSSFCIFFT